LNRGKNKNLLIAGVDLNALYLMSSFSCSGCFHFHPSRENDDLERADKGTIFAGGGMDRIGVEQLIAGLSSFILWV
jgi:hypothetical protein